MNKYHKKREMQIRINKIRVDAIIWNRNGKTLDEAIEEARAYARDNAVNKEEFEFYNMLIKRRIMKEHKCDKLNHILYNEYLETEKNCVKLGIKAKQKVFADNGRGLRF